jgi:hypothetical protein
MPLALLIRDLLLPVMWIDAWINNEVVWRGSTVSEARTQKLVETPAYAFARRLTSRRLRRSPGR